MKPSHHFFHREIRHPRLDLWSIVPERIGSLNWRFFLFIRSRLAEKVQLCGYLLDCSYTKLFYLFSVSWTCVSFVCSLQLYIYIGGEQRVKRRNKEPFGSLKSRLLVSWAEWHESLKCQSPAWPVVDGCN